MSKIIFISGPISGIKDYETNFRAAESYLFVKGWTVLNPAMLPSDMPESSYVPIDLAMLNAADAIVMLDGWSTHAGCLVEHGFALKQGKRVFDRLELVPNVE